MTTGGSGKPQPGWAASFTDDMHTTWCDVISRAAIDAIIGKLVREHPSGVVGSGMVPGNALVIRGGDGRPTAVMKAATTDQRPGQFCELSVVASGRLNQDELLYAAMTNVSNQDIQVATADTLRQQVPGLQIVYSDRPPHASLILPMRYNPPLGLIDERQIWGLSCALVDAFGPPNGRTVGKPPC